MRPSLLPAAMIAPTLQVATYSLPPRLAFPIPYNIFEALFVGSPGENILLSVQGWCGNYRKEIEVTSTNSAANYHENQFFQKDH